MTFNLQQLRAFATTVTSGSLGRAAEVLHVTQPALSRTIKRLEDQVGAPLFERHSKGMQLTAIGSALLPHATLLQREADHAREEIDAMRSLAKGTIRVGAVASIATLVLPLAVSGVLARWPNHESAVFPLLEPLSVSRHFGTISADRHAAPPASVAPRVIGKQQRALWPFARFHVREVLFAHESGQRFAYRHQQRLD